MMPAFSFLVGNLYHMEELYVSEKSEKNHKKSKKKSPKIWRDVLWAIVGSMVLLFIFGTQYATGEFGFLASLEKSKVKPTESVVISFNQPIVSSAVEKNFEIEPSARVNFLWSGDYQRLEVKPDKFFEPGKKYSLKIDPRTSFSFSRMIGKKIDPVSLSFETESAPKVISMSPLSGDPNVKIDSALKISFDKSTTGYDVNFVIEPFSSFDLSYDKERKDFTITPKAKFEYATDYAVSVREALVRENLSVEKMPEVFRANFKTEISPPPPPTVQEVRLPEKNSPVVADAEVATTEAKIKEGKYIDINLTKQQLSIFENGDRLGTYKVSTGKRGMATPTGTFKVLNKAGRAYSRKYNLFMPYWMAFTSAGHGIHELPEWKNGYKEGAAHLGIPVSHGCVRLGVGPAAKVYNWAEKGTPVVIHY